jgi:hypothetical protein
MVALAVIRPVVRAGPGELSPHVVRDVDARDDAASRDGQSGERAAMHRARIYSERSTAGYRCLV